MRQVGMSREVLKDELADRIRWAHDLASRNMAQVANADLSRKERRKAEKRALQAIKIAGQLEASMRLLEAQDGD